MLLQSLSSLGIFGSLIVSSLLPYCLLSSGISNRTNRWLSLCNCVACGIFLSTCFLGLIPHVRHHETLLRASLANNESSLSSGSHALPSIYLSTEFVILAGFLLILLIEQSIFMCSSVGGGSHSHGSERHGEHRLLHNDRDADMPLVLHSFDEDEADDADDIIFRKEPLIDEVPTTSGHGHAHLPVLQNGLSFRSLLLLMGLSIHSLFEGLALGLQKDHGEFLRLLVAIMLHEVLCCLAYGVSLAQQRAPRTAAIVSTIVLAGCIPLGMYAAFLVDVLDSDRALLLRFVLEGVAAGTFIYVAGVEMLPAEIAHTHDSQGVLKAMCVILGAALFLTLKQLSAH